MIDYTPVGYFAQNLLEQQDNAAQAQGDVALALVEIYRAMGGGWQIRLGAGADAPKVEIPQCEPMVLETSPLLDPTNVEELPPTSVAGAVVDGSAVRTVVQAAGMMRRALSSATDMTKILLIVGLWTAMLPVAAGAAEIGPSAPCCEARCCCTCPDDYCPKPLPCVPCVLLGKCDCYCRKPMPCPPCPLGYCGPNDYCPKPYSICLPLCSPAWYTCGAVQCTPAAKP